jgi:hypothetical protein
MKAISVTIPTINVLKSCVYSIPENLTDEQLIRKYGQLKAANTAWINGKLPASYYGLSMYGRVPNNPQVLSELSTTIIEYESEINKRKLFEKFELTVSCIQKDADPQ